jgi:hypothetical protein
MSRAFVREDADTERVVVPARAPLPEGVSKFVTQFISGTISRKIWVVKTRGTVSIERTASLPLVRIITTLGVFVLSGLHGLQVLRIAFDHPQSPTVVLTSLQKQRTGLIEKNGQNFFISLTVILVEL